MAVITELHWKVTWDFNNHLTSHLPVGVSIQFSIHRHSFLLALGLLDTQLHTPPSVAIGGLLSPNIPPPLLVALNQTTLLGRSGLGLEGEWASALALQHQVARRKNLPGALLSAELDLQQRWHSHIHDCDTPVCTALSSVQRLSMRPFSQSLPPP